MSSLLEAIKNKRQAIAAKAGRERPVKLASAKNLVRILPRWDGNESGTFWQDFGQHFIKNAKGEVQAVYICTANTFGRPCDVCAALAEYSAAVTDEDLTKTIGEARASSRVLVNALYLNGTHANPKEDPVLLELPQSVLNDILGIMETYMEDHNLNIVSLQEGYDLVINKSGSGRDTKYSVTPSPKPRAIDKKVLEKARDLEAYANQEYDEGKQKALAAMRAVYGGALPPALGTPSNRRPALSAPAAEAPMSAATTLSETEVADLDALEVDAAELDQVAVAQVEQPEAAAPAANAAADELSELDALLDEALGGA